jgi:hypothetical protein
MSWETENSPLALKVFGPTKVGLASWSVWRMVGERRREGVDMSDDMGPKGGEGEEKV